MPLHYRSDRAEATGSTSTSVEIRRSDVLVDVRAHVRLSYDMKGAMNVCTRSISGMHSEITAAPLIALPHRRKDTHAPARIWWGALMVGRFDCDVLFYQTIGLCGVGSIPGKILLKALNLLIQQRKFEDMVGRGRFRLLRRLLCE